MLLDRSSRQLRGQIISNSIERKVSVGSWNHKTLVPETGFIAPPRQRLQRSRNTENQLATNTRVRTMLALTNHCIIPLPTYLIDMILYTATGLTVCWKEFNTGLSLVLWGFMGLSKCGVTSPFPSFSVPEHRPLEFHCTHSTDNH